MQPLMVQRERERVGGEGEVTVSCVSNSIYGQVNRHGLNLIAVEMSCHCC
jgi:hypothetical protein